MAKQKVTYVSDDGKFKSTEEYKVDAYNSRQVHEEKIAAYCDHVGLVKAQRTAASNHIAGFLAFQEEQEAA